MIPMALSRREIEVLLDSPNQRDFVVSAYADMAVQDGFHRYIDRALNNEARAVREAIATAAARRELDANIEAIREAVRANRSTTARGLAVFSGAARGLRRVIPLEFPVENHLVIDEEPFLLPILEHWHGEPFFLIALVDANQAHLFDLHHSRPVRVRELKREDADEEIQRDKPRFTYKKRFAATAHERLHGPEESPFLRQVADALEQQWNDGDFAGLILLGRTQEIPALRKLLSRQIEELVVGEATRAMTTRPDDLTEDVSRLVDEWRARRERRGGARAAQHPVREVRRAQVPRRGAREGRPVPPALAHNPRDRLAGYRVLRLCRASAPRTRTRLGDCMASGERVDPGARCRADVRSIGRPSWRSRGLRAPLVGGRPTSTTSWPGTSRTSCASTRTAPRGARIFPRRAIAATYPSRERFLTEITLDPPAAASARPIRRGWTTTTSSCRPSIRPRGRSGGSVYVLNGVDGCIPSDMATGRAEDIDEERRLFTSR